jgi:DNA repair protein RecO (recombination protein O)
MNRVDLERAFVLHRRPYSNTSLIVEFFTEQHGRVAAMARSARGPKSRYRGHLELFFPMMVSWVGRGDLKTLGAVEFDASPFMLEGDALLCGFYLNELLMRLLERDDPFPQLFNDYTDALQQLACTKNIEVILRLFEKKLLKELGYGLSFANELQTGEPIVSKHFYRYVHDRGFIRCQADEMEAGIFKGSSLLAVHRNQYAEKSELLDAKRLMRLVLAYHLGRKPLKSRDLLKR